jgi:2-methylisocitrate lyase-like PEP mutase family enzyme
MDPFEIQQRSARFVDLHDRPEVLVLPNPWDAGTAKLLENAGFEALATTSAGLAFSLGRRDGDGAVRALGRPFVLTARAENFIRGRPDLDDTLWRLQAYEEVGADVLYAPGLPDTRFASCAAR